MSHCINIIYLNIKNKKVLFIIFGKITTKNHKTHKTRFRAGFKLKTRPGKPGF